MIRKFKLTWGMFIEPHVVDLGRPGYDAPQILLIHGGSRFLEMFAGKPSGKTEITSPHSDQFIVI